MKIPIEMTAMVGVDNSQQDTASLFTLDKKCSFLRKLLRVLVYVLKFIKIKVLSRMSTSYFSHEGITWKFTTALAPWQGGFYERLVNLVKQGLRKGMSRRLLHWDKLLTMLAEVEAMINTSPLTYV